MTAACLVDHTKVRVIEPVADAVRRWHDDEHADPFTVCQHPVCRSLRETL
jgi:hypothetical protein